jgi:hypothetical protein
VHFVYLQKLSNSRDHLVCKLIEQRGRKFSAPLLFPVLIASNQHPSALNALLASAHQPPILVQLQEGFFLSTNSRCLSALQIFDGAEVVLDVLIDPQVVPVCVAVLHPVLNSLLVEHDA